MSKKKTRQGSRGLYAGKFSPNRTLSEAHCACCKGEGAATERPEVRYKKGIGFPRGDGFERRGGDSFHSKRLTGLREEKSVERMLWKSGDWGGIHSFEPRKGGPGSMLLVRTNSERKGASCQKLVCRKWERWEVGNSLADSCIRKESTPILKKGTTI